MTITKESIQQSYQAIGVSDLCGSGEKNAGQQLMGASGGVFGMGNDQWRITLGHTVANDIRRKGDMIFPLISLSPLTNNNVSVNLLILTVRSICHIRWANFPGGQSITRWEKTCPAVILMPWGPLPNFREVRIDVAVDVDHTNSLSLRSLTS